MAVFAMCPIRKAKAKAKAGSRQIPAKWAAGRCIRERFRLRSSMRAKVSSQAINYMSDSGESHGGSYFA